LTAKRHDRTAKRHDRTAKRHDRTAKRHDRTAKRHDRTVAASHHVVELRRILPTGREEHERNLMRMYAFCGKCGRALSFAGGLCPPCMRAQRLAPLPARKQEKKKAS
jgi:hypothetical protein